MSAMITLNYANNSFNDKFRWVDFSGGPINAFASVRSMILEWMNAVGICVLLFFFFAVSLFPSALCASSLGRPEERLEETGVAVDGQHQLRKDVMRCDADTMRREHNMP